MDSEPTYQGLQAFQSVTESLASLLQATADENSARSTARQQKLDKQQEAIQSHTMPAPAQIATRSSKQPVRDHTIPWTTTEAGGAATPGKRPIVAAELPNALQQTSVTDGDIAKASSTNPRQPAASPWGSSRSDASTQDISTITGLQQEPRSAPAITGYAHRTTTPQSSTPFLHNQDGALLLTTKKRVPVPATAKPRERKGYRLQEITDGEWRYIPVENLGPGIFRLLGDAVGKMVATGRVAGQVFS